MKYLEILWLLLQLPIIYKHCCLLLFMLYLFTLYKWIYDLELVLCYRQWVHLVVEKHILYVDY